MQSKPHYDILDALRGVAAIAVVCYHLFEAIAFSAGDPEQKMFHGFLAVDFFFILSGFVWVTPMTTAGEVCRLADSYVDA